MLKKFSAENFKGFDTPFVLDLGSTNNYGFHSELIQNSCITKAMIYGNNGNGKSNLGLALFDIIFHLTDKENLRNSYHPYLNLSSEKSFAEFLYEFSFDGHTLVYRYKKSKPDCLLFEDLFIDDKEVI